MIKPPAVKPPARLGVLAPASPVRKEFVDRGVAELERLGFEIQLSENLYSRHHYTAGEIQARLDDFMAFWRDPSIKAIFCARGGYGSMELLSHLNPEELRETPKILLGSSDITALSCLLSRAGIVSLHGPMLAQQIARGHYDADNLLQLLSAKEPGITLTSSETEWLHPGTAEGVCWGGCLSMVAALVGTEFLPRLPGSILFLEDTQVKPYQIDRMLSQLRLAGCFDEAVGLVFGQMPNCDQHPEQGYQLPELLRELTAGLAIPVLYGFPSGHTTSPGITLPLGVRMRLDASGLTLLEGVVR